MLCRNPKEEPIVRPIISRNRRSGYRIRYNFIVYLENNTQLRRLRFAVLSLYQIHFFKNLVRRSRGGRHYVDNSEIKECDAAVGDNGVVHVVDRVLLPENLLRSPDGIEERVSSVDGLTKIFSSLLNGNQFNQQNFF